MNPRFLLALPMLVTLAACVNPPAPPPAPPPPVVPPAPPVAAVPPGLDGTYIGQAIAAPRQRACRPQRMNLSMTVSNGHAVLAVDRRREVESDINSDGSVSFNTDMGTVDGKFANGAMTGQGVRMGVCNYNFSLKKQG
ncbi:hypothetical protein [Roseomonas elaeocarpi]|uniref:Lipoprotein n=1 Tax=Roseomonas elaeocarpi TaxID=907779 RepID=A0ABV6JWF4_9PROT